MLSATTITSLMKADNSIIKVKEDRDIEHDESSITYDIREDVDKETDTASESEETDTASESDGLCSTSQILPNITDVNASQVESNIMKGSDYPTFMSDLAKPIMGEQNTVHPPHSARQTKPKSESATAGIVKGGAIQLGIRCEVCETCFQNQKYFEDHVINGQCKWVCKLCTKAFVYSNYKAGNRSYFYSLFKEKLDKHKKECDCTCKLCGFSCQEPKRLASRMKCRHSQQYACDVCLITFKSEMNLYTHKISKHTSKTGMYCCPLCPKEYQMLASVSAHLRFSHLGHKKREMPCSVCG